MQCAVLWSVEHGIVHVKHGADGDNVIRTSVPATYTVTQGAGGQRMSMSRARNGVGVGDSEHTVAIARMREG